MKDLIIVGAGPAGSVCAYHAAKNGLAVMLIDKKEFPRFKSCGGALSLRTLANLGPKGKRNYSCTVDGLCLYSPKLRLAEFTQKESLRMIIRKEWDHQLFLDAVDAGAESITNMVVDIVKKDESAIVRLKDGKEIKSRFVVIADGTGNRSYKTKFGFTQPYDHMARTVCVEVEHDDQWIIENLGEGRKPSLFFGVVPRGYGWLFPKKGFINIGIGFGNSSKPNETQFQVFDRFARQLKEMQLIPEDIDLSSRVAHPVPFKKPFDPIGIDNMLVVGDAGGFVSPVTGEGLYYGTASGRFAAEAISEAIDEEADNLTNNYRQKWMSDFGKDMIKYGLWIADFVYKSNFRMETFVRLLAADKETRVHVGKMVFGLESYKKTRNVVLKRAPVSLIKSLRS